MFLRFFHTVRDFTKVKNRYYIINEASLVLNTTDASVVTVIEAIPFNRNLMQMKKAVPEIQHFNEDGNVQAEIANYDCNSDSASDVESDYDENSESIPESLEHAMDELELTSDDSEDELRTPPQTPRKDTELGEY